MSSSRIKGRYIKASPPSSVGATRWLDPDTGSLYREEVGGAERLAVRYSSLSGNWASDGGDYVFTPSVSAPTTGAASTYADGNPKSIQGAKKYSLRYLPLAAEVEVNRALEDGAKKYGPANWRSTGVAASVYIDAALRHIKQYYDGAQDNAADSSVHNLGHAMACLAIIIDAEKAAKLIDDRPKWVIADTDALLLRPQEVSK